MRACELAFFVDDVPAATAQWQALLHCAPVVQSEGIAIFQPGKVKILLHEKYLAQGEDPPGEDHVAFASQQLEADIAQLEREGCRLLLPPRDYDWGRSAYLRDKSGGLIELSLEGAANPEA